ncbi:MAG: hypothetical protein LBQ09_01410 [Acidobacteriaceae bacterium]|nr:hypothetical protein [Acidobacteriaceae bacterium]
MSAFSTGIQMTHPQAQTGQTGYDPQQIATAELGRQIGQVGMETTRKNMNIQPTLQIRPGYRFVMTVTKDMILPPWTGGARPQMEKKQ